MATAISVKDPKNLEIEAPCAKCGVTTTHHALVQVQEAYKTSDFQGYKEFYVIKCGGCKTLSFCTESTNSEDIECDEEGRDFHVVTQEVFPNRVAGRPVLEGADNILPTGVAEIYKETHQAIASKQSILAGIGLRAIVEAVCQEKSINGRDLLKRIDNMVQAGIITPSGAEILHAIRIMGNESAHEVKANSEQELVTALEVVEHLLSGVYIIPKRAAELRKRNTRAKP